LTDQTRITVAVFCGSKSGNNPLYADDVSRLGQLLGDHGFDIVYGGSHKGLMGDLANNALVHGSKVIGVLPEVLLEWEHQHDGLTELIITKDMHERKRIMYQKGAAGIVLPGGFGTLDEMFEMLTWNQLSIHNKKLYILNTDGFYDHLIAHLESLEKNGFLYDPVWDRLCNCKDAAELMQQLLQDLKKS
jgi:uncharacterized protein (TIGR00730 family)